MTRTVAGSKTVRRQVVLAAAGISAVVATGLLSGCGAGRLAQTAHMTSAVQGANADVRIDDQLVSVRDVFVAYPGTKGYQAGGRATLSLRVFNGTSHPVTLNRVSVSTDERHQIGAERVVKTTAGRPAAAPSASKVAEASPSASTAPSAAASPAGAAPSGSASPASRASAAPSRSAAPSGSAAPAGSASPAQKPSPSSPSPEIPTSDQLNITIAPWQYVDLTADAPTHLMLLGLTRPLAGGGSVLLRFEFDRGATNAIEVPVGPPASRIESTPIKGVADGE